MAEILKGAAVTAALNEKLTAKVQTLKSKGVVPTLAILRVGERPDDISYETGAMKRCDKIGVAVKNVVLPGDVDSDTFFATLDGLNKDPEVHGILMFRPLPKHLDNEKARQMLAPEKDIDGCTDGSLAGVFTNTKVGFPPCTAEAAMAILDYYGIDCTGKRAVVMGRSLVIGRPAAMMLMHKNATVTVTHRKTVDTEAVVREADIVIAAIGEMEKVDGAYFRPGQVVIDVGIGWNEEKGKLCGDVKFDEVEPIVDAITPVPGGVGTVTTSILVSHVVEAAERTLQ